MSEKNPWQVLAQRPVYENKWITLTEYDVINPNGGKGIYGKVHFKNVAIGIIVLDEVQDTYLVGQYRFTIDEYSWEIPMGGGDADDPLGSAKRELLEETGLVASQWTQITKLHLSNSVTDEYGYIFLARGLEQRAATPEETEQLVVKKMSFEAAWQMAQQGAITDAISLVAIQKLKWMISQGKLDNNQAEA
ncbi:MAG: NUDIX hydrolase [Chitinophagaceae bacterium]|nr:NUDIX hydrolase [Chitinophagaceae bacterium]